jgi:hypothetical protein
MCYIIKRIARQRNLSQVAGVHRDGEIMLDRTAQLSQANCTSLLVLAVGATSDPSTGCVEAEEYTQLSYPVQ